MESISEPSKSTIENTTQIYIDIIKESIQRSVEQMMEYTQPYTELIVEFALPYLKPFLDAIDSSLAYRILISLAVCAIFFFIVLGNLHGMCQFL